MYGIFLAQVVKSAVLDKSKVTTPTDDIKVGARLGVKVLPQMAGLRDDQCPLWPTFLLNHICAAVKGDYVWVICNEDFSLGYVLGLANQQTFGDSNSFDISTPSSFTMWSIDNKMKEILGETLDLNNILVDYWDVNCIHFTKRKDGSKYILYRSGTYYIMKGSEFVASIDNGSSSLKISPEGISLNSKKKINIQAPYVGIGDNAVYNIVGSMADNTTKKVKSVRV